MNRVVAILMKRDKMTKEDAENYFNDVRKEIAEAAETGDYDLVEEIMYSELVLEMDYIMDVL